MKSSLSAIFVLVSVGAITAYMQFSGVSFEELTASNLAAKFAALVFVALVIERAVEVFVNSEFAAKENEARRAQRVAQLKINKLNDALDNETARVIPAGMEAEAAKDLQRQKSETVEDLRTRLARAQVEHFEIVTDNASKIELLKDQKKTLASRWALGLGLASAAVGVRVFAQIVPVVADNGAIGSLVVNTPQYFVFSAVDVVVTALLLAGGAQGIHNLLGDFLKKKNELDSPT